MVVDRRMVFRSRRAQLLKLLLPERRVLEQEDEPVDGPRRTRRQGQPAQGQAPGIERPRTILERSNCQHRTATD